MTSDGRRRVIRRTSRSTEGFDRTTDDTRLVCRTVDSCHKSKVASLRGGRRPTKQSIENAAPFGRDCFASLAMTTTNYATNFQSTTLGGVHVGDRMRSRGALTKLDANSTAALHGVQEWGQASPKEFP